MPLDRVLEPEVMDTWEDAIEYDAMDFTEVNSAFAQRAAELGPPNARVLDVGTGTARIPILICQRRPDWHITAIDLSSNMLKVGEKNVCEAALKERIHLQLIDAKTLPFPDGVFDMVVSNSIVHHIPEPLHALEEMRRVLKKGGALLVRDLFRPATQEQLEELVERVCANDTPNQKKLFRDSLHAALTLEEVQILARKAGLTGCRIYQSSDRHWTIERAWRATY
jgi:ubiquinone/menaquinone biosynthesis C-methylase UbiE